MSESDLVEYRRKLEQYTIAWRKFEQESGAYWRSIDEKRQIRREKRRKQQEVLLEDYVLTQPPTYTGPSKPVDPTAKEPEVVPKKEIPVIADFLRSASERFGFVPQRPASESEFKRAYAAIASAAGLSKDQAVRIYAFESGGNGKYDVQAGLEYDKPNARAISTALGYNQLLTANTVSLLAAHGSAFVSRLERKASGLTGEGRRHLEAKVSILKRMISVARAVPNAWSEHVKLGALPDGLGMHALNLDIEIGPLLQTQKLLDSVVFARRNRHNAALSAAELELMNLTGDGNGFDMVTMPAALRSQIPTANFFQQGGYERNSIARRNNMVSTLLAAIDTKMDKEIQLPGARDLAAAF